MHAFVHHVENPGIGKHGRDASALIAPGDRLQPKGQRFLTGPYGKLFLSPNLATLV